MNDETEISSRYLSEAEAAALFQRVVARTKEGDTTVAVESRWTGNLRWARNAVTTAGDTRDHLVRITRTIRGASGAAETNSLDDASLAIAIETAERMMQYRYEDLDANLPVGAQKYVRPHIWSESAYTLDGAARSATAEQYVEPAFAAGMRAAGYLRTSILARGVYNTRGLSAYYAATDVAYSCTIRNPSGTGSGWAGVSHYDWAKVDGRALSAVALEKCRQSANPVAVEPGRYVAILEPQAVYDLLRPAVDVLDRAAAERNTTVYTLSPGQSKIGLKVFDDRITIRTDPMDATGGYIPFDDDGMPYRAVTWVDKGVLKELAYDRDYALDELGRSDPLPNSLAFRVDGGTSSIAEMIESTERGVVITRLSGVQVLDPPSLLCSGVTRDGLWLVERGKITKPIKNFRFSDSPMFVFNNVQQIGAAVPVYASHLTIVPSMKVHDFNLNSSADAV